MRSIYCKFTSLHTITALFLFLYLPNLEVVLRSLRFTENNTVNKIYKIQFTDDCLFPNVAGIMRFKAMTYRISVELGPINWTYKTVGSETTYESNNESQRVTTSHNESKLHCNKSQRVKIAFQQVTTSQKRVRTSQKRVQRVRIITTSRSYKLTNAE